MPTLPPGSSREPTNICSLLKPQELVNTKYDGHYHGNAPTDGIEHVRHLLRKVGLAPDDHDEHVESNRNGPHEGSESAEHGEGGLNRAECVRCSPIIPNKPIKIREETHEMRPGHQYVRHREVDQQLASSCPEVFERDVGQDDQTGSQHGQDAGHSDNRLQSYYVLLLYC